MCCFTKGRWNNNTNDCKDQKFLPYLGFWQPVRHLGWHTHLHEQNVDDRSNRWTHSQTQTRVIFFPSCNYLHCAARGNTWVNCFFPLIYLALNYSYKLAIVFSTAQGIIKTVNIPDSENGFSLWWQPIANKNTSSRSVITKRYRGGMELGCHGFLSSEQQITPNAQINKQKLRLKEHQWERHQKYQPYLVHFLSLLSDPHRWS